MSARRLWASCLVAVAVSSVVGVAAMAGGTTLSASAAGSGQSRAASVLATASAESSETTTLPARMAYVGDARQLIVVTAAHLGETTATVHFFELRDGNWVELLTANAWLGRRGLHDGAKRKMGDHTTPTGIWRMPGFVFGAHPSPPVGTKMRYRHITNRTWWSSRRDKTFNTWVVRKGRWSGEHLAGSKRHYEFAVSTGFNAPPNTVRPRRGCAIFLHVHASAGGTAGCVAVSRADMIRVFSLLDPAKKPRFAIGTTRVGDPTSIFAY